MPKVRDFLTIEQALSRALEHLSDEDLQATKKKKVTFRDYADPSKQDRNITLKDTIDLDIALMKKGKGHPLFDVYHSIMEKALEGQNLKPDVTKTLLNMGERVGKLMGVTEKAMEPSSPGGSLISPKEKENIYDAIKDLEEKITNLKSSIK